MRFAQQLRFRESADTPLLPIDTVDGSAAPKLSRGAVSFVREGLPPGVRAKKPGSGRQPAKAAQPAFAVREKRYFPPYALSKNPSLSNLSSQVVSMRSSALTDAALGFCSATYLMTVRVPSSVG